MGYNFKETMNKPERFAPGHRMCAGCGATICARNVLRGLHLFSRFPGKFYKNILRIGLPTAIQSMIYCMISMVLTRMVSAFGAAAIAVQRVGGQIESVSWMVGDGFSAAVNAFLGQNYGAKRYDRVRRGYFCAIAMTAAWGLCTTFLLIGMARPLFSIFLQEEEVMAIGVNYLRISAAITRMKTMVFR